NARVSLLPDGNILVLANKGVYALSATNGQRLWECSACQRFAPNEWGPIGAYPLWEAGSLLSLSPDVPSDSLQRIISWWSLQGYLVLNATNGRVVFDSRNNEGWQGVYGRAVLPSQGLLVIFGIGSKDPGKFLSLQTSILAAYDVRTGQLKWRRPAGDKAAAEQLHSNLVAYDGKIYFLTNRALYAVDAATGNTLWRHEIVKGLSLRPTTGTYLFIDEEKDWVVAFGRGRVTAVRRSDGQPVWQKPISIPRDNILHAFSTSQGILLFTDDVSPGSPERPTGNNIFMPPLAVLLSYENGANVWGERISTPGLLVGYIPLDENRLLCLFQRERLQRSNLRSPADNWKVEVDVLDLQRGRFLFKRPISLKGALLHAQTVPGGFLVQTVRRLQYISEEGQVLWEKPIKRPFSLPFAVREAGGTFQAFLIDETGQVFRWDGPPTEPRPIGQKLTAFQNDPPQGIAYEQGKLWIWGGSTLYAIDPEGKVECEFARPVPAQPAALRLLGAAISIAGYATSAYLGYKALQTVAYEPERSWDRPDVATTLKKVLTATAYSFGALGAYVIGEAAWTALVEARQARMKEVENLAFLLGMENSKVFLYAIDKLSCEVKLRRELGSLPLFMNPQYELDPIERRLFVVEERSLHAYAF
ncbi:MAG: PQQ-like beta-propeller repeat protein, partial [Bacteroidia bacterium]|nr:PQQ-like beta-propeller repeat protein [Bacteroidia bacterium]MDW8057020.1 PQQ-binding-like beta-propeller repeat protein [Bacteroidia bacterium]